MPFIKCKVSCPVSSGQETGLKTRMGKAIELVPGKSEEYLLLEFEDNGIFVTEEEYSEFVRTEIVVNAVTHRDYGIKGTDIQIKMFDDRLEVDSPGSFAGGVKKENIRYTHFSRNPKIAAFLKDYGYVKEYGEGVDRMCKELEAVGLPDPEFDNSTFILKTTVKSASFESKSTQNARIDDKNARIGELNPWEMAKNARIEFVENMHSTGKMTAITSSAIIAILEDLGENQVIGSQDVQKILNCKETKALRIINEMKKAGIIVAVAGKGKGKYILNVSK